MFQDGFREPKRPCISGVLCGVLCDALGTLDVLPAINAISTFWCIPSDLMHSFVFVVLVVCIIC